LTDRNGQIGTIRINSWFFILCTIYIQIVTDKFKNIASSIKDKLVFSVSINWGGIKTQKDTLSLAFNKNIGCLVRIVMLHMSNKRKGNSTQEYQNIEETLISKLTSIL